LYSTPIVLFSRSHATTPDSIENMEGQAKKKKTSRKAVSAGTPARRKFVRHEAGQGIEVEQKEEAVAPTASPATLDDSTDNVTMAASESSDEVPAYKDSHIPEDLKDYLKASGASIPESDPGLFVVFEHGLMDARHAGQQGLNLDEKTAKAAIQDAISATGMWIDFRTSRGDVYYRGTIKSSLDVKVSIIRRVPWALRVAGVPNAASSRVLTGGGKFGPSSSPANLFDEDIVE